MYFVLTRAFCICVRMNRDIPSPCSGDTSDESTDYETINADHSSSPLLSVTRHTLKETPDKPPSLISITVVWVLFFILGIGTLLPWNLFITSNTYFIRKSGLENFEAYLVLVAQTPNFTFFFLTLFIKEVLRASPRVYFSLGIMLFLFLLTIVFTEVDIPSVAFTIVTFICVAIINALAGLYQTTVIGMTGVFPSIHTQAVFVGQGLGGILPPTILILSKYIVSELGTSSDYLDTSATIYFSFASVSILLCIITYIALTQFPYSKKLIGTLPEPRRLAFLSKIRGEIKEVGRCVGIDCFNVFFIFLVTLSVFPALTSAVIPQSKLNYTTLAGDKCFCSWEFNSTKNNESDIIQPALCSDWTCLYFTPVFCFLAFNLFDFIGRIVAGFFAKVKVHSLLITISAIARTVFIPLILLCDLQDKRFLPIWFISDYIYLVIVVLLGITNGILTSISLMQGPRKVSEKHRETAAMLLAISIGLGLLLGSCFSLVLENIFTTP